MANSLAIEILPVPADIAAIAEIRSQVFQKEQGISSELEFDGMDRDAIHLLAYFNGQAVGTTRIRDIDAHTAKIERLAVLPHARKQGIGTQLMSAALKVIAQQNKTTAIVHAQEYIAPLYQKLGFELVEESFMEAGISHIKAIAYLSRSR